MPIITLVSRKAFIIGEICSVLFCHLSMDHILGAKMYSGEHNKLVCAITYLLSSFEDFVIGFIGCLSATPCKAEKACVRMVVTVHV